MTILHAYKIITADIGVYLHTTGKSQNKYKHNFHIVLSHCHHITFIHSFYSIPFRSIHSALWFVSSLLISRDLCTFRLRYIAVLFIHSEEPSTFCNNSTKPTTTKTTSTKKKKLNTFLITRNKWQAANNHKTQMSLWKLFARRFNMINVLFI